MSDLVRRLRDPAFGTETSERNLMNQAADRIEQLEAALRLFACPCADEHLCSVPDNCRNYLARTALEGK